MMYMTEEEAKKKWCPMARLSIMNQSLDGVNNGEKCIASDCMMWSIAGTKPADDKGFLYGRCGMAKHD